MPLFDFLPLEVGVNLIRFPICGVLLFSGYGESVDNGTFREFLRGISWLRPQLTHPLVVIMPSIQLFLGAWLIYGGDCVNVAALGATVPFGVFAIVFAVLPHTGRKVAFGCFGPLSKGRMHWSAVERAIDIAGLSLLVGMKGNSPSLTFAGAPAVVILSASIFGILVVSDIVTSHRSNSISVS